MSSLVEGTPLTKRAGLFGNLDVTWSTKSWHLRRSKNSHLRKNQSRFKHPI